MCVYEYNLTHYKVLSLHNCESWLKFTTGGSLSFMLGLAPCPQG